MGSTQAQVDEEPPIANALSPESVAVCSPVYIRADQNTSELQLAPSSRDTK